jgi:hypothetical protein
VAACLLAPVFAAGQAAPVPRPGQVRPPHALEPEPERLARLQPEELARLLNDPFNFFRFANTAWAERVCEHFARELDSLPTVRLHGDAHVEQYAVTRAAYGLDDFDDSTRGPSVVDLVRFLGSVDLAARTRGWTADTERLFDRFLAGYRQGLERAELFPSEPTVVRRLRVGSTRDRRDFLAWADGLMRPMEPGDREAVGAATARLATMLSAFRPEYQPSHFKVKMAGWLRLGVGGILTRKVLVRVEGLTSADADDVILEAKKLSDLHGVSCVEQPKTGAAFRVVTGAAQVGRLRHDILAVLPPREAKGERLANYWIRSWDDSYVEVRLADLASADELAEIVFDSGLQLGTSNIYEPDSMLEAQQRRAEMDAIGRLEPRIRALARALAGALLERWRAFAGARSPRR